MTHLRMRVPKAPSRCGNQFTSFTENLPTFGSYVLECLLSQPRGLLLEAKRMNASSGASRDLIRVLVADSNQTQSQLLSSALRRQPGLKITCCRSELSDCLQALRSTPADIVLLGDGPADHDHLIETLRALHANHPRLGLILLLDSYDRNLVVNAMRSGVRGLFCRATQPFRALCRCIALVYQGQFWANTEQMGMSSKRSPPLLQCASSMPKEMVC